MKLTFKSCFLLCRLYDLCFSHLLFTRIRLFWCSVTPDGNRLRAIPNSKHTKLTTKCKSGSAYFAFTRLTLLSLSCLLHQIIETKQPKRHGQRLLKSLENLHQLFWLDSCKMENKVHLELSANWQKCIEFKANTNSKLSFDLSWASAAMMWRFLRLNLSSNAIKEERFYRKSLKINFESSTQLIKIIALFRKPLPWHHFRCFWPLFSCGSLTVANLSLSDCSFGWSGTRISAKRRRAEKTQL